MSRTAYNRVYVWNVPQQAWEQIVCADTAHQANTVRARLLREGRKAVLGLSTIGPPEGPPAE